MDAGLLLARLVIGSLMGRTGPRNCSDGSADIDDGDGRIFRRPGLPARPLLRCDGLDCGDCERRARDPRPPRPDRTGADDLGHGGGRGERALAECLRPVERLRGAAPLRGDRSRAGVDWLWRILARSRPRPQPSLDAGTQLDRPGHRNPRRNREPRSQAAGGPDRGACLKRRLRGDRREDVRRSCLSPAFLFAFLSARGAPPPLVLARRLRAALGRRRFLTSGPGLWSWPAIPNLWPPSGHYNPCMPHSVSSRFPSSHQYRASLRLGPRRSAQRRFALPSQAIVAPGDSLGGWFDRPMRWAQLTLVENDPAASTRILARLLPPPPRRCCNASAGGIVAYYPTAVHCIIAAHGSVSPIRSARSSPAAAPSVCTWSRAPIRTRCATTCRRRIPIGFRDQGWDAVTALGQPRSLGHVRARSLQLRAHGSGPPRDRLDVQGGRHLREPGAPQGGDCFCVHCVQNFKNATVPRFPYSPTTATRFAVNSSSGRRRADRALEAVGRHGTLGQRQRTFIPNGPPDLKTAGELAAIQFTDNQARRGLTPPWNNGRRAKNTGP